MSENNNHQFVISKEDWSLHRKGHDDQQTAPRKSSRCDS